MAYQALATPEAGANLTGKAPASPKGKRSNLSELMYSGTPIWLIPAARNESTEAFGPLWVAPRGARIVAVGRHNFLPITAIAWISDRNEIVAAIEGDRTQAGHSVLIRVWTRESSITCRVAVFEAQGERAVARAVLGAWDGVPVAGLTLVSLIAEGEEQ